MQATGKILFSPGLWVNLVALAGTLITAFTVGLPAPWPAVIVGALGAVNVALHVIWPAVFPAKPGPAPIVNPNAPIVDPNHPASPLMALLGKIVDAVLAWQISAAEGIEILTPAIAKTLTEAEAKAPDVQAALKAEAGK